MTREFIELPEFVRKWKAIGLNDNNLKNLEEYLCKNPSAGVLVTGTGGLRKLRWQTQYKGKRGGTRVMYIDFAVYEKTYLLTAFAKNEKTDLSADEKNKVKKLIKELERSLKEKKSGRL